MSDDWKPLRHFMKEEFGDKPIHVIPNKDIKEHEESLLCWCKPKQDKDFPQLILHNAFAPEYGNERDIE